MSKYIVTRDNYGFKGKYWTEGEIVELASGENPPRHFKVLESSDIKPPKKAEAPLAFSQINMESEKPKTGMALVKEEDTLKRKKSK